MNGQDQLVKEDPCWSTIGVWSSDTPSCPKLKENIHCANCEVFVSKGRELFELEPSGEYLNEWTKLLDESRLESLDEGESILIFRLEEEWLAFPTASFKFVSDVSRVHPIPHKSDALLLGLANAGDALQICFSLKTLLGIEPDSAASSVGGALVKVPRFLALERNAQPWLFQADEVLGVFKYDPRNVQNIPSTVSKANPSFVCMVFGFEGRSVGLLDDELVVYALKRSTQ